MKKTLSTLLAVCMLIGIFSGVVLFSSAAKTDDSYTYVQLTGVQDWTASDVASMVTFGASYALSDKGLIGNATQSVELTVTDTSKQRFCLATQSKNGGFLAKNPFRFADASQGYKLSDFDGIAIAFSDADGNEIPLTQFQVRLMRDATDWGSYWLYEGNYYDMNVVYANGYYHLKFDDYKNLSNGEIDNISILSALFYKSIAVGDKAYISDICAYTKGDPVEPPEEKEYEYLQLDGVQKWTQANLAQTSANNGHVNNVTATYSLSDQQLVGAATQSIKAVKSQSGGFNCLVNKAYDSNDIACPSPWKPSDGVSKLSDYDGVMIAVKDANGNMPVTSQVRLRILTSPALNGWQVFYMSTNSYEYTEDGYYMFPFTGFSGYTGLMKDIDSAQGISFLLDDGPYTEYYFSDFLAYREKRDVDYSALESALAALEGTQAALDYPDVIAAAQAVLDNPNATQEMINEQVVILKRLMRETLPAVQFDEDNIVFTFGAVSDIHIDGTLGSSTTNKYLNAARLLKKYSGGNIDAITVDGDFSQSSYNDNIPQAYKSINDEVFGEDIKSFFITGNHDAQGSDWSSLNKFYNQLGSYCTEDEPGTNLARGNRHMVINGYHFIGVNMMDYWNSQEARFDPQDLVWLDTELAAARAAAPGKHIFVYTHAPVFGTTYGSDLYTGTWWGSRSIYDHLKDYPEVVTFGGHVHFPLEDERTIYQRDFTSLNCGSVQYMAIENGYLESGSKTTIDPDSWAVSDGLMLQIDAGGNVKITRIDFGRDAIIKQPFYIPAPDLVNKTNLMYYDDYRFEEANEAPAFPEDATVTAAINGSNVEANFTAANDDDMVHRYVFEITGIPSGRKTSAKSFSEFYNYPQVRDMPKSYRRLIPYTAASGDRGFELAVYAVDSGGKTSEPIIYNSIVGEPDIKTPSGMNLINAFFITGEPQTTGLNGLSVTTRGDAIKNKTKYGFSGAGDSRMTIFAPSSAATLTARKFAIEAAFEVGTVGAEQYIFSCSKDDKGFSLYLTADGHVAFDMYTTEKYSVVSEENVNPGEYHSVMLNFQSGVLTLYLDGSKSGEAEVSGNAKYNTNVGYTVAAHIVTGSTYGDFFDGVVYQVGLGSSNITAENAADRAVEFENGWNYKYVQSIYNEYEAVKEALALNANANESAKKILNNYLVELEAALNAVSVNEAYINTVLRSEAVAEALADFGVAIELPELNAPVVGGVADGETYTEPVTITWDESTNAELDHAPFENGSVVKTPGEHRLFVQNKYESTAVYFTLDIEYEEPTVSVEDGAEFKLSDFGEGPLVVTWTPEEATATLNGEAYTQTFIEEPGEYTLVVTNGDKSVTVHFTIVDDTPVPVVSVEDGAQFDLYNAAEPLAITWTPEGATATLNGEEYAAGTEITEVGEYTLVVVNGSKSVTVGFTVVDTTPAFKKGDPTGNGKIEVDDALAALRVAAKLAEPTPELLATCDIDGNGKIEVDDALAILRVAAKLADESSLG